MIIKKNTFLLFVYLLVPITFFSNNNNCLAQELKKPVQKIRGKILDKESKTPLFGASVALFKDTLLVAGTTTNENGDFAITNLSLGKYIIRVTYIGYLAYKASNIELTSAKEINMNIDLSESALSIKEVVITGNQQNNRVNNDMATVSARTFSIEEASRYAGSRGEPSRMASNYAGVNGGNDSRNDIIVRGNSPLGIVWRLEGIDIPNPNHFTVNGNTGGPVSILNNKTLANSDFLTGAFPAEYGNGISGVFDLKMRNGNNDKHEKSFQFGFLGTELALEGPLSKKSGSSYLVTYRYATLSLFSKLKIPIGTDAVPAYQDASFKLNFPLKKGFNLSFFGVGGLSDIDIIVSNKKSATQNIYGDDKADQYFGSDMGVVGASISKQHKTNAFSRVVVGVSGYDSHTKHNFVNRDSLTGDLLSTPAKIRASLKEIKYYANYYYNLKVNSKLSFKMGINNTLNTLNFFDSTLNIKTNLYYNRVFYKGQNVLIQPFAQFKYKFNNNIQLNAGLRYLYSNINENSKAVEPRLGLSWTINEKSMISAGAGFHSQMQPFYTYYTLLDSQKTNSLNYTNINLGLTNAKHVIVSYDYNFNTFSRLKIEAYHQWLSNVPVNRYTSSYSLINQGASLSRGYADTLTNNGIGLNKGVEVTLEQFFSKSFFALLTASLYDSKYKGSDGILRNTDFNGIYAVNALAGKEFKINPKSNLNIGIKSTFAGGRRYTPANVAKTLVSRELVEDDKLRNTLKFYDYTRVDFRIAYKINTFKSTTEIAIDLINAFGIKNPLALNYRFDAQTPANSGFAFEYQLGLLPLFYIKVDF